MLLTIQDEEKVHIMRARQILERNNEYGEQSQRKFPTHFDCDMVEESKRKFTPWLLEKCLEKMLSEKTISIRSKSKTTFTVDVGTYEGSKVMQAVKLIHGIPVSTVINTAISICKGLIYIIIIWQIS